jgi:hypothetical protein
MVDMRAAGMGMHAGTDAVVVALHGDLRAPAIAGRWCLQLVDPARPELAQPYHAAAEVLGIEAGRDRIALCEQAAREAADGVIATVLTELAADGRAPSAAGLVLGAGRLASTLEEILRSHVQLHTAEGEMLRVALRDAAEARGLEVVGIRERALVEHVDAATRAGERHIEQHLRALGTALGPPWTKRQKHACLAAWAALATSSG